MTGGVSGLAVIVQAADLRELLVRAVTLGYVLRADQQVLGRLELARRRSVRLHAAMVQADQARTAAAARVRAHVSQLELWAFRAYVRDRYGTAARAKTFWPTNGWY